MRPAQAWALPALRGNVPRMRRRLPQGTANRLLRRPGMTEKKWSQDVSEHSDALDLEDSVFKKDDPKEIASSLKRSAEHSRRRKGTPLQSAMGMLTFYINRAGDNLSKERRKTLEDAKDELRALFDEE
jgi:hypothetical protein